MNVITDFDQGVVDMRYHFHILRLFYDVVTLVPVHRLGLKCRF